MADGLCVEATGNSDNDSVVKETVDLLSISHKDCMNSKGLTSLKSSFYIHGDSGELCSNFRVNGVVTLGVHASPDMLCSANTEHVEFTSLCPNNGDNCRKKRCADRYDSSESSDSGVAVLSCTDCSASSSSGTSDITDPGSPYSTASTHSSNCEGSDDSSGSGSGTPSKTPLLPPYWSPPKSSVNSSGSTIPTSAHIRNCHWPVLEADLSSGAGSEDRWPSVSVMAPNVPSEHREAPCWSWGDKDKDVEMDRDRGPPPPPPPLLAIPAATTPLASVTANLNTKPSSLKRQTAIVNHKTAAAVKKAAVASTTPNAKRLKVDPGQVANANNNNNNNTVKSTSPCMSLRQQPQRCCTSHHNHHKFQCTQGKCKCCSADNSQPKAPQQGKITEYFKTQMKPLNGIKKELAVLGSKITSDLRSPSGQTLSRKGLTELKSRESDTGLDKYFNLLSGTTYAPSSNIPHSKLVETNKKDLVIGTNVSTSSSVQILLWNNKFEVEGSSRSSKTSLKNGLVATSTSHARKSLGCSITALKIPEVKKNGVTAVSPSSLSAQKLNALLSPLSPSQTSLMGSTFPPNLIPDSVSYASKTVCSDVGGKAVVCSVPKPVLSASEGSVKSGANKDSVSVPSVKSKPVLEVESAVTSVSGKAEEEQSASSEERLTPLPTCLSVSVSAATSSFTPSLPSPILSVPRTIRFPAAQRSKTAQGVLSKGSQLEAVDSNVCRWSECEAQFETSTGLLEHLQAKHVNPQATCENYVCLWVGCKVYARTSCSRSWLERHVLSHGGNKPFRCIVDGCGQRFSSQTTLERHVNGHFNQTEAGANGTGTRRNVDSVSSKLFRRNGKKLRYRRQPWSARMFDYFDSGIMEGLQHRLVNMTEKRTLGDVATAPGNTVTITSKVLARRVEMDGKAKVLLRWFPEGIVDDEWVLETEACPTRSMVIPNLPVTATGPLETALFCAGSTTTRTGSRRRRKAGKQAT